MNFQPVWTIVAGSALVLIAGCSKAPESSTVTKPATPLATMPTNERRETPIPSAPIAPVSTSDTHTEHHDETHQAEETHPHEHFGASGTTVTNHGIPLFRETQKFVWTPEVRAQKVAARLNIITSSHEFDADSICMRRKHGSPTVFYFHDHGPGSDGHIIATIDPLTAREFGQGKNPTVLAYWWRDVLRDHTLLIHGEAPHWTTPYAGPLGKLHKSLQAMRPGVPTHDNFDKVIAALSPQELEALQQLYCQVPANYKPKPDVSPTAHHAHHDEHDHHHD